MAFKTDSDVSSHCKNPKAPCVLRDGIIVRYHALYVLSLTICYFARPSHHDAPVAGHRGVKIAASRASLRRELVAAIRAHLTEVTATSASQNNTKITHSIKRAQVENSLNVVTRF
jgi:hypothetical protein